MAVAAMRGWDKLLNAEQIWQTVGLLKRFNDEDIPPEVVQELSKVETAQ